MMDTFTEHLKLLGVIDFIENKGYQYYYNDCYHFRPKMEINCSDEPCPGSNERTSKIRNLMHKRIRVGDDDFMEQWGDILQEMHSLFTEEIMGLLDCSEREAQLWLSYHVDFNHVKCHEDTQGNRYLSIDPILK